MAKEPEKTFFQKKYTNGQAHEKMFIIISNANEFQIQIKPTIRYRFTPTRKATENEKENK